VAASFGQWSYALCLAVSFSLAVILSAVLRWVAPRAGMVDRASLRGKGAAATPLLGGVGAYLAVAVSYLLFADLPAGRQAGLDRRGLWLLVGAGMMVVLGLFDDRIGLRARFRLGVQLLGAAAVAAAGIRFSWFPWAVLNYAVSIVWLVGLMNAINCLDCADGCAAGIGSIGAGAFSLIALAHGNLGAAMMAVALVGGCTGFLAFNFPPASIFLGDAGSTFLGLVLGALAIESSQSASGGFAQLWVAALPAAVPVWDIVVVHFRRYRAGLRSLRGLLESKGQDHLPHRLRETGLRPQEVALTIYFMAALVATPGVVVAYHSSGSLALAIEITALGLIAGERPFGALVARLSHVMGGSLGGEAPISVRSKAAEVGAQSGVSAAMDG